MDSPRHHGQDDQIKTGTITPPTGFRPANGGVIKVQPPRREDLQPAYAQKLQGDDEEVHGWYGGMSECKPVWTEFYVSNFLQSIPLDQPWVSVGRSHAASSAPTRTSLSTRAMLV